MLSQTKIWYFFITEPFKYRDAKKKIIITKPKDNLDNTSSCLKILEILNLTMWKMKTIFVTLARKSSYKLSLPFHAQSVLSYNLHDFYFFLVGWVVKPIRFALWDRAILNTALCPLIRHKTALNHTSSSQN